MEYLNNEQILWESKNKQLLLTTHRLREMNKSIFGSTIKSIMLEEITSCALQTTRKYQHLRRAMIYFLIINGAVILLNQLLFKAELFYFLFGEVHIGPEKAGMIFYLSLFIVLIYIVQFGISFKQTFSFYANNQSINFQLNSLDFEQRESFISRVEAAKDQRHRILYSNAIIDNTK